MNQAMTPALSRRLAKAIQPLPPEKRARVYAAIAAASDEAALLRRLPALGVAL